MLMKITHHNDGKEKSQSHDCYLFNDAEDYVNFDITNIHGYGETKEEAIEDEWANHTDPSEYDPFA